MGRLRLPLVHLGWDLVRMDPNLYRNVLEPIWTPFGSLMDHFWHIWGFWDYCWITAGHFPIVPYSPCGVGGMAKPLKFLQLDN